MYSCIGYLHHINFSIGVYFHVCGGCDERNIVSLKVRVLHRVPTTSNFGEFQNKAI